MSAPEEPFSKENGPSTDHNVPSAQRESAVEAVSILPQGGSFIQYCLQSESIETHFDPRKYYLMEHDESGRRLMVFEFNYGKAIKDNPFQQRQLVFQVASGSLAQMGLQSAEDVSKDIFSYNQDKDVWAFLLEPEDKGKQDHHLRDGWERILRMRHIKNFCMIGTTNRNIFKAGHLMVFKPDGVIEVSNSKGQTLQFYPRILKDPGAKYETKAMGPFILMTSSRESQWATDYAGLRLKFE